MELYVICKDSFLVNEHCKTLVALVSLYEIIEARSRELSTKKSLKVDYEEIGNGPTLLLLHSTATGARQWKHFINKFKDQFHFIAVNLIGYGNTDKWESEYPQRLIDQVNLLEKIPALNKKKFSIIGHSFGGSVAMMAALHFQSSIDRLILVEPNPFYLLNQSGFANAYAEPILLKENIKKYYNNDWEKAVHFFADYWNGEGTWYSYSLDQKAKFSEVLKPNYHEWDAVLNETTPIKELYNGLPADTTFLSALDTVFSIKALRKLFMSNCPSWNFKTIKSGGHMALIKELDQVAPIIIKSLLREQKG